MRIRIISIAAAFVFAVAACSSSSSSKVATSGGASSPTAAPTTAAASSGGYSYGSGGASATTVAPTTVAPSTGGAQISLSGGHLVAPDGRTVYLLDTETGTTSSCTGGCASVWPGVASASGAPTAGPGVDATKLSTANGQVPSQVVYNGHLLYEFAGDKAAGDTNGTKIPHWHTVSAAGTAAG